MKRIIAILASLMFCLSIPVITYADDIYYVEDDEEPFVPETTTQAQEETTTKKTSSLESIFGDNSDIGGYLEDFAGVLSGGIDSVLSGFEDSLGNFQFGTETTTSSGLQAIGPDKEAPTVKQTVTTTQNQNGNQSNAAENTTAQAEVNRQEVPSVLIVNNSGSGDDAISGSTLTLLVFVAGVVLLILVGAIVLVLLTRKTDYNSKVKSRSTIPSVAQPGALAQFMDSDTPNDGKDYGNITYWND